MEESEHITSHPPAEYGNPRRRVIEAQRIYPDTLGRRGAMALARRLERYWHVRGYLAARFWAEPIDERFAKVGTYEIYRVVCNLVNGLPPRYLETPPFPRR